MCHRATRLKGAVRPWAVVIVMVAATICGRKDIAERDRTSLGEVGVTGDILLSISRHLIYGPVLGVSGAYLDKGRKGDIGVTQGDLD